MCAGLSRLSSVLVELSRGPVELAKSTGPGLALAAAATVDASGKSFGCTT